MTLYNKWTPLPPQVNNTLLKMLILTELDPILPTKSWINLRNLRANI